ncbi:MAG: hypothetical protein K8R99_09230 [Actinomycetia bacterium]|nr:hypothetical protein [Actinomycetes bacterium]
MKIKPVQPTTTQKSASEPSRRTLGFKYHPSRRTLVAKFHPSRRTMFGRIHP